MEYKEEDYLMLSGIQHFHFCRRRWALIHIEQLWQENYLTVSGNLMHANAHDADFRESRGDLLITRGMSIQSRTLGVSGECDVLEFHRSETGISLKGKEGLWQPYPVEYKHGKPHSQAGDHLQLCGQALCLEEMLCCSIPSGALYYGELHRREEVEFTEELRRTVKTALAEMHDLYKKGYTPKVRASKSCKSCSLHELCLPQLAKKKTVNRYLDEFLMEEG